MGGPAAPGLPSRPGGISVIRTLVRAKLNAAIANLLRPDAVIGGSSGLLYLVVGQLITSVTADL